MLERPCGPKKGLLNVSSKTRKEASRKTNRPKEPFSASDFFTGLGMGTIIGAAVVVILIYLGAWPTKFSVFGFEFKLPSHSCPASASVSIPTLTLTPESNPAFSASLSVSAPTLTLIPESNPAVSAVNKFLSAINKANNEYDYQDAFEYLTGGDNGFQTRSGGFDNFYDNWSKITVLYKLYQCPQTQPNLYIVDAELFYFDRNSPYQAYGSDQIRYHVVEDNNEFKLDSGEDDIPPGANCVLVMDTTMH